MVPAMPSGCCFWFLNMVGASSWVIYISQTLHVCHTSMEYPKHSVAYTSTGLFRRGAPRFTPSRAHRFGVEKREVRTCVSDRSIVAGPE